MTNAPLGKHIRCGHSCLSTLPTSLFYLIFIMNRDALHWIPFLLIVPIQLFFANFMRDQRTHFVGFAYWTPMLMPIYVFPVVQKYENMLAGVDGMIVTSFLGNWCLLAHFNRLDDKFLVPFLASLMLFYIFFGIGCGSIRNFITLTSPRKSRQNWNYEYFFLICHVLMVPFGSLLNHVFLFYTYLLVLDRYLIRNAESLHLQPASWKRAECKDWEKIMIVTIHAKRPCTNKDDLDL